MVDHRLYAIRQINSEDVNTKIPILQKILRVASSPFCGKLPPELYINHETTMALETKRGPWQYFYIADPEKGDIVSAFKLIFRKGSHGSTNLLITFVHTNPLYRKQGFVNYLLKECIKKYDTVGLFKFSAPGSQNTDTDTFIKKHLKPAESEYFWTLYSVVNTFYAQFGFVPFRDMNWVTYISETQLSCTIEHIQIGDGDTEVELIPIDQDVTGFFCNPKYASYINKALGEADVRSVDLGHPTFYAFHNRDLCVAKLHNRELKYTGLRLKHNNGKETFAIVSGNPHYTTIIVHKLFTNLDVATDSTILDLDLHRFCRFLHAIFDHFTFKDLDFITGYNFSMTTADVHTKDPKTLTYIIDKLRQTHGWHLDTSHPKFLPMMKDFGHDGVVEGTKWLNNGFWCFG